MLNGSILSVKTHPRTLKLAQKWRRYSQICNISQIWLYLLHFWDDFNVLGFILTGTMPPFNIYQTADMNLVIPRNGGDMAKFVIFHKFGYISSISGLFSMFLGAF